MTTTAKARMKPRRAKTFNTRAVVDAYQLLNLSLRRFACLVKFIIVEILIIAGAVLCIVDDIVGHCHVVLADHLLIATSD